MANTTGQKFGGRKKGTRNKLTSEIRERFRILVDNNLDRLQEDLDSLEPKDRTRMIVELSKFILPTLKATEMNDKREDFLPVIIDFSKE